MKRICLLLAAAVLLCMPLSAAAEAPENSGELLQSPDGRFQITLPEGFEDAAGTLDAEGDLDAAYLLETENSSLPAYAVFHAEQTDGTVLTGFDDYFVVLTMGISSGSMFSDVELSGATDYTLKASRMTCRKISFSGVWHQEDGDASREVTCRIYAVDAGGGLCGHFLCWSPSEKEKEAEVLFDAIADSLVMLH